VPIQDQADREAARRRLDCNVVVVAGAGTGKTTLLTDRILFNLLGRQNPLPITALVALTFTEKAAGEIRLRLAERLLEMVTHLSRGALGGKARERTAAVLEELRSYFGRNDGEVLARARAALEDLDKAQIGTIHAFAAHLLRLYPLQAAMDPGFRVDEGVEFDELFETQWSRWLDAELGEQASGSRREEWLAVLRWAPLEDIEELARGLAGAPVDLAGIGRPDPEAPQRLAELARVLRQAPQGQPSGRGKILEALTGLADYMERLSAAAASSEDQPLARLSAAQVPQSKWPTGWDEACQPAYESAQKIAAEASPESEVLVRRAGRLLVPFAEAFRRSYARAGLVSFDGLLLKARDLVRDDLAVREELKAKYQTFLVDEFQDTDPLQGELLIFLAEERGGRARSWDQVRPGPGRLFIVGDPKQSIYRFRGADIAAYQGITEHLLRDGGALLCELKTNFRSTAGVLAPVNAIFPKLMRRKEGSQPDYIPISPRVESEDAVPAVEIVAVGPEREGGPEPDAPASQKAQAGWIAGWIASQCAGGQETRPAGRRFKDVAVLMRTSSALAPLLEAFKAASIPYVVEMEKFFYNSQEVIDLLNLLRVLDDPEDRLALAGLLRSPLMGLADEDLRLWAADGKPSYESKPPASWPAAEKRRLAGLFAILRRLRGRVGRTPLGELVGAALDETPLLAAAARAYHGQQSVSNLLKFSRLAAAAADERGLTLKEFITLVVRAMDESRAEGESPLADEHLDAVRVLSIHKAKGLEFPAVLVYNLSGGSARGGSSQAVLTDWRTGRAGLSLPRCGAGDAARALLEDRERQRRQDETVRLLYVALTRAKEKLILLGAQKADQGTLARLLQEAGAWPKDEKNDSGSLPVHVLRAGHGATHSVAAGRGGLVCAHELPAEKVLARVRAERLRRRDEALARTWTRTPTDYLREGEIDRGRPESPVASGLGSLVGQICHKVLALWDFRGSADLAQAVSTACDSLSAGQPEADWATARGEAEKILRVFLDSPTARGLAAVEVLGRELPFVYGEGGAVVRGTIDLVYRKDGRVVVVDFKSEAVTSRSVGALREKYRRQGEDYRAAVARAWGLANVEFRLIFLRSPDLA
jgi:ATP-dependent helicase/nuclease subunit A